VGAYRFSSQDYDEFEKNYSYVGPLGFAKASIDYDDQAKAGIENYGARHAVFNSTLVSLWSRNNSQDGTVVLAQIVFDDSAHALLGAPASAWMTMTATGPESTALNITLLLVNKTATRLPESLFLEFKPINATSGRWIMEKMGQQMDPSQILEGGSTHLHVLSDGGARLHVATNFSLRLASQDVGVVCFGPPNPFPTPKRR